MDNINSIKLILIPKIVSQFFMTHRLAKRHDFIYAITNSLKYSTEKEEP